MDENFDFTDVMDDVAMVADGNLSNLQSSDTAEVFTYTQGLYCIRVPSGDDLSISGTETTIFCALYGCRRSN